MGTLALFWGLLFAGFAGFVHCHQATKLYLHAVGPGLMQRALGLTSLPAEALRAGVNLGHGP